jgi:hypothetical protein
MPEAEEKKPMPYVPKYRKRKKTWLWNVDPSFGGGLKTYSWVKQY